MARIYEGTLPVHYGQAYVRHQDDHGPDSPLEESMRDQNNGLCGAAWPGFLFLTTGLHTGNVGFSVDTLDSPPSIDNVWEEIVEVSFVARSQEIAVFDWYGDRVCDIPLSAGTYRVRYCARNMDAGGNLDTTVDEKPIDFYSLAFWPAPSESDIVVKQTSGIAAYWHNYAQNSGS